MSNNAIKEKFSALKESADLKNLSKDGWVLLGIAALLDEGLSSSMAEDVDAFHRKFKVNYLGSVRMLPEDVSKFRIKRAMEEHKGYVTATKLENKLDALIDSIYIDIGTLLLHGFSPAKIKEAWSRVHAANMAKERATASNPGKYGLEGCRHDIVKPVGWMSPDHSDLCR